MNFAELCLSVDAISNNFDVALERCELFIEASYNEYITNLQEAELKVIKESGTKEDADSLKGAASEGFLVRAQKTIQKIIDAFIQAMKALGNNIAEFFNNAENKVKLKKINEKAKNDQEFGSKKIETGDPKAFETAQNKIDAVFQKVYARAKGGKVSKDEVDKAINLSKEEYSKATKATITVSIAAALAYITSHGKAKEADYEKRARILFNQESKNLAEASADDLAEMSKAIANHTKISKQLAVEKFKRCVSTPFNKIKTLVTGNGEAPLPKSAKVEESTLDDDMTSILDAVFEQVEAETEFNTVSVESVLDSIEEDLNKMDETKATAMQEEFEIIEEALGITGDEDEMHSGGQNYSEAAIEELSMIEEALGITESSDDEDDEDEEVVSEAAEELALIEEALGLVDNDDEAEPIEESADESVEDILADLEELL